MPLTFDDLPLEIIQYVFSLCCRSQRVTFIIPHEICSGTAQVTLLLVCSRWRAIALNTSTLWDDVMVNYYGGEEPAQGPTASFQFVQKWLNRAGMTQISLSISAHEALESQIAAISQTLLSSFRITNLDLESVDCHHLLLPTNNLYYLERLELTLDELMRPNDAFPRLPKMPSLKELCLSLHPSDFADVTNIYLIPWHQLRVFTLRNSPWTSQMLFNILQLCKSLVECNLLVKLERGQHEHDIVLPNLESLMLYMNSQGSADPVIRSLTVPNLRSLDIRSRGWYMRLSLSLDTIIIMVQRSGFNKRLTDFSLGLTVQPVDVRSLLGIMPALERVQLHGPLMFQPGTFDDLSSGAIGPHLEEIYFGIIGDEEILLMLEAVGQRHEKAKTRAFDIRPFASVTCCNNGSNFESHKQRAKQCSEAFNTNVEIDAFMDDTIRDSGGPYSDFSMDPASDDEWLYEETYIDEELGSITIPGTVFAYDEEPLEG